MLGLREPLAGGLARVDVEVLRETVRFGVAAIRAVTPPPVRPVVAAAAAETGREARRIESVRIRMEGVVWNLLQGMDRQARGMMGEISLVRVSRECGESRVVAEVAAVVIVDV